MSPALSVCIEMVFADRPYPERVAAAADAGADAVEIWGWREKDLDAILDAADDAGIGLAAMVSGAPDMTDPDNHEAAVDAIEESVETAETIGCPNVIVTVGQEQDDLDREAQREAIVDALAAAAPAAEAAGVALVVEPLNTAVDHPGYFLTTTEEGIDVVEAVDSPAVQLLYDVYHQQITEGNVIETITEHVDQIGHVHFADVPGRREPGTGELNYANVFDALADAGYEGYVGAEFSPSGSPEDAMEAVLAVW